MRAVVEFSEVVEVTVSPGVSAVMFLRSVTPASRSCCPESAITAIGTSCRFCSRFCAVTTTSASSVPLAVPSAAWLTLPPGPSAIASPSTGNIPLKAKRFESFAAATSQVTTMVMSPSSKLRLASPRAARLCQRTG